MIEFRDSYAKEIGAELIVHQNREALEQGANPFLLGTQKCCGLLKTKALLDGLAAGGFNAAFGGARRDEEKSRAKERIYSFRDAHGQWDPKNQRPELWNISQFANRQVREYPRFSAFELDRTRRLAVHPCGKDSDCSAVLRARTRSRGAERIDCSDLFSKTSFLPGEKTKFVNCRMRSLGCVPCTGAIRSEADTVPKIIEEMISFRRSERENRAIDHDEEGSMEIKKREGYF